MKPYALISDTHHHNWTAFSTVNADGVNSRLQQILDETARCADELGKAGGDTIIHAGDLFHVRGSVAPSVLNPTLDLYRRLCKDFRVILLAGNHDLEGKEASDLGSAITALKNVGCVIANGSYLDANLDVMLVPWTPDTKLLKTQLEGLATHHSHCDLILHAGIDGVIKGLPDHGLSAEYLEDLGFKRIFAGHYHHHKKLSESVWSIGALTHQTWGDIGTKAGFMIVDEHSVDWRSSHAPQFVEITDKTDTSDIPLIVDGNYVRAKLPKLPASDIEEFRQYLLDSGALGVSLLVEPTGALARSRSSVKAGASLEVSVEDFIKASTLDKKPELSLLCAEILKEAREAA